MRMPAEWEAHSATWLTWPHDEAHWPGKFEKIPPIFARMVKEIEKGERVEILIHDEATERTARDAMEKAGVVGRDVRLHRVPNNFSWARDHGPIFVKDSSGNVRITHWRFNAWGNKWNHDLDSGIPARVSELTHIPSVRIPMVLEGGSIDANGKGTLLTTESCLMHPNRNPGMNRGEIEEFLRTHLGVRKVLWLGEGIEGDDTDGHVDDLTRFVGTRSVLTVVESDRTDVNFEALSENVARLERSTDQDGVPLEIHEIPLPKPVIFDGMRLPASYANFYISNAAVLLPVFNDKNDRRAVDVLERAFPTREIIPLDARDLVWGLGAFHCLTQQQPK